MLRRYTTISFLVLTLFFNVHRVQGQDLRFRFGRHHRTMLDLTQIDSMGSQGGIEFDRSEYKYPDPSYHDYYGKPGSRSILGKDSDSSSYDINDRPKDLAVVSFITWQIISCQNS